MVGAGEDGLPMTSTMLGTWKRQRVTRRATVSCWLLVVMVLAGVGCHNDGVPPSAPSDRPVEAVAPSPAVPNQPVDRREPGPPVGGVDEVSALHGQSEAQVLSAFGPPDHEVAFTMDECCTEFSIELFNTYPPNTPGNADIHIRELTWRYEGYALTVWLHRAGADWVALDTCRYGEGTEF